MQCMRGACFLLGLTAAAFAQVPQALSDFKLIRVVELKGATYHVQGIDFDDTRLWVTSVDRAARKGYLHEFSLPGGELRRTLKVGSGEQFHPGGIARDGDALWVPVAEYRRESSATIQRRAIESSTRRRIIAQGSSSRHGRRRSCPAPPLT